MNSLAAITIKDFLDAGLNIRVADNKGAVLSKWISVVFGGISFLLILVVKEIGSVMKVRGHISQYFILFLAANQNLLIYLFSQAALTFNGIVGGINLGLFSLGMFIPWINSTVNSIKTIYLSIIGIA